VGGADVVWVLGGIVRVGVEADAGGFCFAKFHRLIDW
jgi:hypothetical protein